MVPTNSNRLSMNVSRNPDASLPISQHLHHFRGILGGLEHPHFVLMSDNSNQA